MQKAVRELADAIGIGLAHELVRRWGGREIYIPLKVEHGDPLALTLGFEAAKKLVKALGGVELQLPIERNALLDLRNEKIRKEYEAGSSAEAIGLRYGLTRQAVMRLVRAEEARRVTGTNAAKTCRP